MDPFEMVVAIVAIVFGGSIISKYLKARLEMQQSDHGNVDAEMEARIENMEKRLKVLEQIITSDRYDLEQQFKRMEKE